ncbi:hypothetical protein DCAR_0830530 [Daucus carota subsp. sativus]|uniref:Uncharacterized protein n=1 Tax=Daucus carota subsp. sativus TaxID=79200 RepID=A0AAF0XMX2_DAUCS|nr:hypothetical protein DCAR_0830530 [Daucus carota subsp. sativus]
MATLKSSLFLVVPLLISLVLASAAEARQLSLQSLQTKESALFISSAPGKSRNSKLFRTLGMVCRCCDSAGGDCRTKWLEPCPNLECRPWKQIRS